MAIKFGSLSGYKTRTDYRVSQAELDCGDTVHMFIKTIEESNSIEDEYSICSIGIIGSPNLCYENVSIKIREEASPKYKPTAYALGKSAEELALLGVDGTAVTELACTPIKIKSVTIEMTATYKDSAEVPTPEYLNAVSTADAMFSIADLIDLPTDGAFIITSKSQDSPADDFQSNSVTYTKKIPYPTDIVRDAYLASVPVGITVNPDDSTVEIEATFRQGEVPLKRVTVTKYGLSSIPA